ncbi:MAG: cyclic nucleotide-binding domain-containing protein [Kofleriaceae bacterium]|nr:cyclic nucleotide-binding domain-containing protein [Kofleriaceae bacterium]MBP6839035.1 cyclic nucleotide-binding domain-containing protein [Kofleriaceae bacterium]MBP9203845.1 cyclic nucleotide-binding domain-containing protein [Kofleriaceae bacterium]
MSTALLERHPLMARLPAAQLDQIARFGAIESWNPGEDVVREGSLGDALYLVLTGRVAVRTGGQVLADLRSGDFFGEMSLVEPATRSATVTAVEPAFLFRLPHEALRQLLTDDPTAASVLLVQIVKTLSERLRRGNHTLASVGALADWLAGSSMV